MPRIEDIVTEALEIVFNKLDIEPLVREGLTNTVKRKVKTNTITEEGSIL